MAPVAVTDDYYEILCVSFNATPEVLKKSYYNLALRWHPDKNTNNPAATAMFQLLNAAYEVLSDAQKRREYNVRWPSIKSQAERKRAEAERTKNQETNPKGTSQSTSSKTRLGEIEALRKAHEAEKQMEEREDARQREQLKNLRGEKVMHESDIFELKRVITRFNAELKRFNEEDEEDMKKDAMRNHFGTYLSSLIFWTEIETEEAKRKRDKERLNRQAGRTVKLSQVQNATASLEKGTTRIEYLGMKIEELESKIRMQSVSNHNKEIRRKREVQEQQARHRREEEMEEQARRAAAEKQKRDAEDAERARVHAEWLKKREEEAEKARLAEMARKRRQKEVDERERQRIAALTRAAEQEAERARLSEIARENRQREADERERQRIAALTMAAQQRIDEQERRTTHNRQARQRNQQTQAGRHNSSHEQAQRRGQKKPTLGEDTCGHKQYWIRKEGVFSCSECNLHLNLFAYECRGCSKTACADCRTRLRREKKTAGRRT